jgi:hypothetical protein
MATHPRHRRLPRRWSLGPRPDLVPTWPGSRAPRGRCGGVPLRVSRCSSAAWMI